MAGASGVKALIQFLFGSERRILAALKESEGRIMVANDDLKAAIARLSASTSAELKAIAAKLAAQGDSVSSADVEAAVTSINAAADTLDAETATLTGTQPAA